MKPTVICLTPVKNEAWILDRFLKAASLWADHIIIADQMSTDGSREIALSYTKVRVINNTSVNFNELGRKRLLIQEARKIHKNSLLITLDADEMFSPEFFISGEWDKILQLPKGTAINFQWVNFAPDLKQMWKGYYFPWGYMDDGFEDYDKGITDSAIHCARIPISENTPEYNVKTFSVIHFQYTDWERMKHKHYYYQCLEIINNPQKSAVDIYRQYHHMDILKKEEFLHIPINWVKWYKNKGIDILDVKKESIYWYDKEVIKLFEQYGIDKFKKIDIWKVDWNKIANAVGKTVKYKNHHLFYLLLLYWLQSTQKTSNKYFIRKTDKLLRICLHI